jgi:hypothetical protein
MLQSAAVGSACIWFQILDCGCLWMFQSHDHFYSHNMCHISLGMQESSFFSQFHIPYSIFDFKTCVPSLWSAVCSLRYLAWCITCVCSLYLCWRIHPLCPIHLRHFNLYIPHSTALIFAVWYDILCRYVCMILDVQKAISVLVSSSQ